jgi:hypothetical protein
LDLLDDADENKREQSPVMDESPLLGHAVNRGHLSKINDLVNPHLSNVSDNLMLSGTSGDATALLEEPNLLKSII